MRKELRTVILQIVLFVATFFTTTIAGAQWVYGKSIFKGGEMGEILWNDEFTWDDFFLGTHFSIPFLLILTVHEFGHYIAARIHKIKTTLPFFIPLPLTFIGTMGAFIRIKERIKSNVQNFDVGIAGPLAGFVVALIVIAYGFLTLPPAEHIFEIHPEYKKYGLNYADSVYTEAYMAKQNVMDIQLGTNLLFEFFSTFVADESRVPNAHEMMHSPALLAGFFALFFTAMNLLPFGQLDGGHVIYGLFGWKWHRRIATVFFIALIFYGGLGMISIHTSARDMILFHIALAIGFYYFCFSALGLPRRDTIMIAVVVFGVQFVVNWLFPAIEGQIGWMIFGFIASRFAGVQYPPAEIEVPLDPKRVLLGWIALIVFIISFSPRIMS